ncbi:MAG TPA: hypothetical protein DEB24_03360 [Coriobacteriia bacterium]|nr:hypothetical protein [Coriobacteriia bacterium]
MTYRQERPLIARVLSSWILWVALVLILLAVVATWSSLSIRGNVTDNQVKFVTDNVRRSAVQCYAIEGRFPSTQAGVGYLEENYGLAIDHSRYRVYYESIGDNLVPQVRVVVIGAVASGGE